MYSCCSATHLDPKQIPETVSAYVVVADVGSGIWSGVFCRICRMIYCTRHADNIVKIRKVQ